MWGKSVLIPFYNELPSINYLQKLKVNIMKRFNSIILVCIGFLLINTAINVGQGNVITTQNNSSHLAGEFAGDYYYYLDWNNHTFPAWEYNNEYQYWETLWLNNGTEDTWVMVVIDYNLTIVDSGDLSYLYFEIYDDPDGSFLDNYEDNWTGFEEVDWESYDDGDDNSTGSWDETLGNLDESIVSDENYSDDFVTMDNSLDGDEGLWFIDIYFEEWFTTYSGYINYTWYNVEYNDNYEIIVGDQLDPALLCPASTSPYEEDWYYDWDWEWAQIMLSNESYSNETYSWTWFSYDIGQWVSVYDNVTNQYSFVSQDIAYMGMSLYDDMNGNGVVDSYYENLGNNNEIWLESGPVSASQDYKLNTTESEEKYSLSLESVGDVEWGTPKITENTAEFWICLKDINFLAIPYASNYNWFMEDSSENNLSISSYVEYLNISFYYTGDETGSSIAVKHDITDFSEITEPYGMINEFSNLSMTIDYYVYSDKYSEILDYDEEGVSEAIETENLYEAVPVDGNVSVDANNEEFMTMDYSMNYTWGKDGNEYENTIAINPLYGYQIMYSNSELGQASTIGYESSSYMYSMCFNWDGYAITMDPTFVSFYKDFDGKSISIQGIGLILLLSLSASAAVIMVIRNKRKVL